MDVGVIFRQSKCKHSFLTGAVSVHCQTLPSISFLMLLAWLDLGMRFPIYLCQTDWHYLIWWTISMTREVSRTENVVVDFQCRVMITCTISIKLCYTFQESLFIRGDYPMEVYGMQKDFKTPYSLWTCHPQTWASWYGAGTFVLWLVYALHLREGIHILHEVFFTDEAWFHFSGNITRQNSRIWSAENLQTFCVKLLHSLKIGVLFLCGEQSVPFSWDKC